MKNKLLAILVVLVCVLVFVLTVVFMIQYEPPNKCVYDLQGRAWHGMQVDVSFFTDNLTAEHRDGQVIFLREWGIIETALCPACSKPKE